jgi:hypothetical protein
MKKTFLLAFALLSTSLALVSPSSAEAFGSCGIQPYTCSSPMDDGCEICVAAGCPPIRSCPPPSSSPCDLPAWMCSPYGFAHGHPAVTAHRPVTPPHPQ